jgi:hypothetical protein
MTIQQHKDAYEIWVTNYMIEQHEQPLSFNKFYKEMQAQGIGSRRQQMIQWFNDFTGRQGKSFEERRENVPIRYRNRQNYYNRESIGVLTAGQRAEAGGHIPQYGQYNTVSVKFEYQQYKEYYIKYSSRADLIRILQAIRRTNLEHYELYLGKIYSIDFENVTTSNYQVFDRR